MNAGEGQDPETDGYHTGDVRGVVFKVQGRRDYGPPDHTLAAPKRSGGASHFT